MIHDTELVGIDEITARRVLAIAASIAPCIKHLPEGDNRDAALAILQGVALEAKARGSRLVKSQRIGPASVDYTSANSWFSADDRTALRALCAAAAATAGSVGNFPASTLLSRIWPESEHG